MKYHFLSTNRISMDSGFCPARIHERRIGGLLAPGAMGSGFGRISQMRRRHSIGIRYEAIRLARDYLRDAPLRQLRHCCRRCICWFCGSVARRFFRLVGVWCLYWFLVCAGRHTVLSRIANWLLVCICLVPAFGCAACGGSLSMRVCNSRVGFCRWLPCFSSAPVA